MNLIEDRIAIILKLGLILSSSLIGIGLASLLTGFESAWGQWLVTAGLVVLVATPILRVVMALFGYLMERDFTFVMISLSVLLILVVGVWVGAPH